MNPRIEVAVPGAAAVGEGPHWDAATATLSWVDIPAGAIHRAAGAAGAVRTTLLPVPVGAAVPKASGGMVAATGEGFADVGPDGRYAPRPRVLPPGQRMNDAKCDPAGRFWAGSTDLDFAPGQGALHVLAPDGGSRVVLTGLTLPNGMAWSPDGRTMYLVDTMAGELNAFDTDPERPRLARRRLLAEFAGRGIPDGMALDAAGCLWIAMWGGFRLLRVSPDGDVLAEVPLPVEQPASCAFGGPGLDVLYVTTAREGLDLAPGDIAGSVLAVRGLGVTGLPAARFAG
jgi:sugar lactone lactonase YvrE